MQDVQRRLGQRIKDLRERRGLTQEKLAERSGYTSKYVSEVERGKVNVPLVTLCTFARALGASASEILVGVDVPLAPRIRSVERLLAGRSPGQQTRAVKLLGAVAALMDAGPKP